MKKNKSIFIGLIILCVILFSTPVLASSIKKTIEVIYNSVNLEVNGQKIKADNILYNGTTYVPLRAVADALGKDVDWDEKTKTASINDKKDNKDNEEKASSSEWYFHITKEEKNEAIENGKKGSDFVRQYMIDNDYILTPNPSDNNIFIDNIYIETPFLSIMQKISMLGKYAKEEDIKYYADLYEIEFIDKSLISFSMVYNCSSFENPKSLKAVIEQDGKYFYPTITFAQSFPKITNSFPDFPAYQNLVSISYQNNKDNKIDLTKKAKLIIEHIAGSGMETVYEIDFSKYK